MRRHWMLFKSDPELWLMCVLFRKTTNKLAHIGLDLMRIKMERDDLSRALAEAYQTLDRIALRDDSPSPELSKLAYDFIDKHKLTVQYH